MEQRPQHKGGKIHVFGPQKFLSNGSVRLLQVYGNTTHIIPRMDQKQYQLNTHAREGFVFLEIRRTVWGLPQAGILANKLLRKRLDLHGYYECVNTPGLSRHPTRPISTFSLIVDDFGIKYFGKEHAEHLIKCLKEK